MHTPEDKAPQPPGKKGPKRPFTLLLIFLVFLFWAVMGWLRFAAALTESEIIFEFIPQGLFWYLLLGGLVRGLAALPVLWGVLRAVWWTPRYLWIAALFYPIQYWVERLFLWQDPDAQRNWPFILLLTGLWLSLVFWVYHSNIVTRYFGQNAKKGD